MQSRSIIIAVLLIGLGIVFGVILVSSFKGVDVSFAGTDVEIGSKERPLEPGNALVELNNAYRKIAQEVTPSVVFIVTTSTRQADEEGERGWFFHFFGPDMRIPHEERGAGSGVILSKDGYILTNNHVVEGADNDGIEVTLWDNRKFVDAKVIGVDPFTDLAVIKIGANDLNAPRLGNSDDVEVGHMVFAIGNPLGLTSTMTSGIVSALGRQIRIVGGGSPYGIENFIQTDAAVNPGNSGGALVNVYGEVIGINTAIATTNQRYQGYSFAIPINLAKKVAGDIIKYGKVKRGYIGISIETVDSRIAKAVGFDKPKGVFVRDVNPGSGGEEAGIKSGDIILTVDGRDVNTANELQTLVGSRSPGDQVALEVFRDGKTLKRKVTLKPRDDEEETLAARNLRDEEETERDRATDKVTIESLGITVKDLDESMKKEYDVRDGVLVVNVDRNSEAFARGIAANDVIVEVGDVAIESSDQLSDVIGKMKRGDAVLMRLKGPDKRTKYTAVEIPKH